MIAIESYYVPVRKRSLESICLGYPRLSNYAYWYEPYLRRYSILYAANGYYCGIRSVLSRTMSTKDNTGLIESQKGSA